ncbi:hypothetical protein C8R44DRAFT_779097 [Mycena epipterygia]|nr:hypothetical protein C8R44DRAFT_779097 [Mycena epipterygia]
MLHSKPSFQLILSCSDATGKICRKIFSSMISWANIFVSPGRSSWGLVKDVTQIL